MKYLTFLDYTTFDTTRKSFESKLSEKDKQIEELQKRQKQVEQFIQSLIDTGQLKPTKVGRHNH
jgi:hypothetical protein